MDIYDIYNYFMQIKNNFKIKLRNKLYSINR